MSSGTFAAASRISAVAPPAMVPASRSTTTRWGARGATRARAWRSIPMMNGVGVWLISVAGSRCRHAGRKGMKIPANDNGERRWERAAAAGSSLATSSEINSICASRSAAAKATTNDSTLPWSISSSGVSGAGSHNGWRMRKPTSCSPSRSPRASAATFGARFAQPRPSFCSSRNDCFANSVKGLSSGQSHNTATLTAAAAASAADSPCAPGSAPVTAQPHRIEPSSAVNEKVKPYASDAPARRRSMIPRGKQKKRACAGGAACAGHRAAAPPGVRASTHPSKKARSTGGHAPPAPRGYRGPCSTKTWRLPHSAEESPSSPGRSEAGAAAAAAATGGGANDDDTSGRAVCARWGDARTFGANRAERSPLIAPAPSASADPGAAASADDESPPPASAMCSRSSRSGLTPSNATARAVMLDDRTARRAQLAGAGASESGSADGAAALQKIARAFEIVVRVVGAAADDALVLLHRGWRRRADGRAHARPLLHSVLIHSVKFRATRVARAFGELVVRVVGAHYGVLLLPTSSALYLAHANARTLLVDTVGRRRRSTIRRHALEAPTQVEPFRAACICIDDVSTVPDVYRSVRSPPGTPGSSGVSWYGTQTPLSKFEHDTARIAVLASGDLLFKHACTPGDFSRAFHRAFRFPECVEQLASAYATSHFKGEPFIGLHLRADPSPTKQYDLKCFAVRPVVRRVPGRGVRRRFERLQYDDRECARRGDDALGRARRDRGRVRGGAAGPVDAKVLRSAPTDRRPPNSLHAAHGGERDGVV